MIRFLAPIEWFWATMFLFGREIVTLIILLVLSCSLFAGDGLMDDVEKLKASTAALNSMMARMQSDITDIKADVAILKDKLDALAKAVAPQSVFAPPADPWSQGSFKSTTTVIPMAPTTSGYGMGMGSGACAGGSCGTGGRGIFGRIFGRR